jgi:hypothetical protein
MRSLTISWVEQKLLAHGCAYLAVHVASVANPIGSDKISFPAHRFRYRISLDINNRHTWNYFLEPWAE